MHHKNIIFSNFHIHDKILKKEKWKIKKKIEARSPLGGRIGGCSQGKATRESMRLESSVLEMIGGLTVIYFILIPYVSYTCFICLFLWYISYKIAQCKEYDGKLYQESKKYENAM